MKILIFILFCGVHAITLEVVDCKGVIAFGELTFLDKGNVLLGNDKLTIVCYHGELPNNITTCGDEDESGWSYMMNPYDKINAVLLVNSWLYAIGDGCEFGSDIVFDIDNNSELKFFGFDVFDSFVIRLQYHFKETHCIFK